MSRSAQEKKHRLGRAATLLSKGVSSGWFDVERIAEELVVSKATVERYLSGEKEIPMERQIVLAKFLIDNVPPLARAGRSLLSQIQAAIAYSNSETITHRNAPLSTKRFL